MKRFLLSLVALGALLGIAHAVNITGVDGTGVGRVVSVGFIRVSTTDAITARAGGAQANAVLLTSAYNRVTVVASAGDSVKLPLCAAGPQNAVGNGQPINTIGQIIYLTNADASDSMDVFPSTGDTINAVAANGAYAMAANKTAAFICASAGKWYSILGA